MDDVGCWRTPLDLNDDDGILVRPSDVVPTDVPRVDGEVLLDAEPAVLFLYWLVELDDLTVPEVHRSAFPDREVYRPDGVRDALLPITVRPVALPPD